MEQNKIIHTQRYLSPCGELILGSFGDRLCLCDWTNGKQRDLTDRKLLRLLQARWSETTSDVIRQAAMQLDEYFGQTRREFDLPLLFVGTEFQQRVWHELLGILFGTTISYGEMARRLGMPKAVRAVANANGANPISIFAPCHRVIGSDGSLTGYGGGLHTKKMLLDLEAAAR